MISKNAEKALVNLSLAVIVFILAMFVVITFRIVGAVESVRGGVLLDRTEETVYNVSR